MYTLVDSDTQAEFYRVSDVQSAKDVAPRVRMTTVKLLKYIKEQAVQPVVWPPQYAPAPCKPTTAFSLEVTAQFSDVDHRTPSAYQV